LAGSLNISDQDQGLLDSYNERENSKYDNLLIHTLMMMWRVLLVAEILSRKLGKIIRNGGGGGGGFFLWGVCGK
jgi:hypothetical protein